MAQQDKWPKICTKISCDALAHLHGDVLGKGTGKTAYYARYCNGSDETRNDRAVVKFYNDGFVFEDDFWSREIEAHKKASKLAMAWNECELANATISVIIPQQGQLEEGAQEPTDRKSGEYVLVEDYLPEFQKFNSNTKTCAGFGHLSIQAFSHWTYHYTEGKYLFCDCQGMFDKEKKEYILTDPVIVSDTEIWSTSYGPCDGGADMMVTWFKNHKCNRYC